MRVKDKDGNVWSVLNRVGETHFLQQEQTGYPRQVELKEFVEEYEPIEEYYPELSLLTKWNFQEEYNNVEHVVIAHALEETLERIKKRTGYKVQLIYTEDFIHE